MTYTPAAGHRIRVTQRDAHGSATQTLTGTVEDVTPTPSSDRTQYAVRLRSDTDGKVHHVGDDASAPRMATGTTQLTEHLPGSTT